MDFAPHLSGWVGKMQLRQTPPFKGWTQQQWERYCARGPYFMGKPHYELTTKAEFHRLVERARKMGWILLARTTNHNGVCPAHLGCLAWMQDTRWHFMPSDHAAVVQIRYMEVSEAPISTPADKLKLGSYFEVQFSVDVEEMFEFDRVGDWRMNGGTMGETWDCSLTSDYRDEHNVDVLFPDQFWVDLSALLSSIKKGKLSQFSSYWGGTYGLPRSQTRPQEVLSDEFKLKYLQQIVRTPLCHHVKEFWYNCRGLSPKEMAKTHLTENQQVLVDRVWSFVLTGVVPVGGLHDCSKHATHCACLGVQDGHPIYIPAGPGGPYSIPWHQVFDMEDNIIGET